MRVLSLTMAVALLALRCTAQAGETKALRHVQTIPMEGVEGRIDHMAVSPDGRQLFVAALGSDMVERIDTEGGTVVGSIGGIKKPQGIYYIPKSKILVLASGGDGSVRIYDDAWKLVGTVGALEDADNVRYDAESSLLYVGYGQGALAVIYPDKVAKVAEIRLDGHPESFQLEVKGKRIFVNVPTAGEIEVIDRETRSLVDKWKLSGADANFPMALDDTHHRLFVGCRKPPKMVVLDTGSGKLVASLHGCGDTDDLFYDAANKRVFLSGGAGCISVFDQTNSDSYKQLPTINTPAGSPTSLFVPTSGTLYVAVPHRGAQKADMLVFKVEPKP